MSIRPTTQRPDAAPASLSLRDVLAIGMRAAQTTPTSGTRQEEPVPPEPKTPEIDIGPSRELTNGRELSNEITEIVKHRCAETPKITVNREYETNDNEMEVEEAADSVDAAKELKRAKAREYYRENKEKKKEQKAREKEEIEENRFKVIEYERQVKDIFKSFKSNWPVLQTMDFRDAKKRVAEEVRGLAYARLTGEVSSPRADQEDDAAADPIDDEEESEPVGKKATKSKKSKAAA